VHLRPVVPRRYLGVALADSLRECSVPVNSAVSLKAGHKTGTFSGHVHNAPALYAESGFSESGIELSRSHLRIGEAHAGKVLCPSRRDLSRQHKCLDGRNLGTP
jgi:hypothetical protein